MNPKLQKTYDQLMKDVTAYLDTKGEPDAYMLRYEGKHTNDEYAHRYLSVLISGIAEAYVYGINEMDGTWIAFARIDGTWHELCAREEDGSLMVTTHALDKRESDAEQAMYELAYR